MRKESSKKNSQIFYEVANWVIIERDLLLHKIWFGGSELGHMWNYAVTV